MVKPINRNFVRVEDGSITVLRDRFKKKKYTVTAYARILDVNHAIVSQVLDGIFNGTKNQNGSTRKVIAELKKDGCWVGPLPWEK